MTDIVKRLRTPIDESNAVNLVWELLSQRSDAADEIERLRRGEEVWRKGCDRDAAEIERLTAALDDCIHGRRDWMEKAKAALEPSFARHKPDLRALLPELAVIRKVLRDTKP